MPAAPIGPILGGIVLEFFWWGAAFLLALPVMALLLVLGPRVLPEYRDPNAGRLDLVSAGMSLVAILSVIYGLKQIVQDGFGPIPAVAILLGLAVGFAWVRRQQRLADPMIDVSLFRIRSFNVALSINFLSIFVLIGYFLFVAQYLQLVVGLSPLEAGLWSLPSALAFVIGSQITPRIVHLVRPEYLIGGGLFVAAIGLAMLSTVGTTNGLATLVDASIVISIGMAPVFGLTTEMIVGSAPPERPVRPLESARPGLSSVEHWAWRSWGPSAWPSIAARSPIGCQPTCRRRPRRSRETRWAAHWRSPTSCPRSLGPGGDAAREAFVSGMQLTTAVAAALALGLSALAWVALRSIDTPPDGRGGRRGRGEAAARRAGAREATGRDRLRLAGGTPSLGQQPHHGRQKANKQREAGELTAEAEIHVGHLRVRVARPPNAAERTRRPRKDTALASPSAAGYRPASRIAATAASNGRPVRSVSGPASSAVSAAPSSFTTSALNVSRR